ncbi:class B sortase [Sutcliffiella halmapala]|uniref:class B sortase n=1 Tax=Sutcliffiella halmapala TaxID=79882 RepID=UPI000994FF56|nr:class B sortase [Sutcliffiella halmapala]
MKPTNENNRKKAGKNLVFQRFMTIICIAVFSYSSYKLSVIFFEYYENRKVLEEIQEVYVSEVDVMDESDPGKVRDSFQPLLAINEDIVAWITIDDTRIDYPILQAEDNDYYLTLNYLHEQSRAGSIFMDFRNDILNRDRHTILYGHRMKDGTMFGNLRKYLTQDFYEEHPTFSYDTLYKSYEVEIFSVYVTTTDFYYIETEFEHDNDYANFIKELQARSVFDSPVSVSAEDQIITLSTCDYQIDRNKGRLVVHGKLTPRSS